MRAVSAPVSDQRAYRLTSIDMVRGLVIVIMALDHVRDFFMAAAEQDCACVRSSRRCEAMRSSARYSMRSAIIGSTRAARRAGCSAASSVTTTKTRVTMA